MAPVEDRQRRSSRFRPPLRSGFAGRSARRRRAPHHPGGGKGRSRSCLCFTTNLRNLLSPCDILCLVLSSTTGQVIGMHREQRFRLRLTFIAIILATLPCYCVGWVMVQIAETQVTNPDQLLTASPTRSATATSTPKPTHTERPTKTLLPPTLTRTATHTPTEFMTWTPPPSSTPTYTLPPPPTDTEQPTITPQPSETPTLGPATATDTVEPPATTQPYPQPPP